MSTAFLCAANKSACYMNLTQQIIEPVSCQCSLPHIDLRLPSQVRRNGKGKHMVWRDEHKDAFVSHMLENETVLQSFRNSIRNQEHQSCYKHFLDLNTLAATGMTTRRMSRRMQLGLPMAPWYDATCRDYKRRIRWNKKHNQPFAELQLPAEKKQFKKEMADEMVGLTDARSPEVYKLLTANKRSDTSLISAESWTEHLQSHFVKHK